MTKKAVLLLSGGLDSATTFALAQEQGFEVYALSFRYGQRHGRELESARLVADALGAKEHKIADIDLRLFGGSALTADIAVPHDRSEDDISTGIPITYVPARNTIFLSFALAWAEVLGAYDIFIGVNALDYSGYPDCRPAFIEAFEKTANLATAYGVEAKQHITIHTPIIAMTKAEIIAEGLRLGLDYQLTFSCYDPLENGRGCGTCHSCILRGKGFEAHGLKDPAL
jgi:7-cyano-7-deazaguanine synthase